MNELNFFSDKLLDINREMGISGFSGYLETSHSYLSDVSADDILHIDIFQAKHPTAEVRNLTKDTSTKEEAFQFHFISNEEANGRTTKDILSAVCICLFDDEMQKDMADMPHVASLFEQYKTAVIVDFFSSPELAEQFSKKLGSRIQVFIAPVKDNAGKNIVELIRQYIPDEKTQAFIKFGKLNAVKPILDILNQAFQSESKSLQTRKLLSSQSLLISKKEEQNTNHAEMTNNIKQAIQKYTTDIDKNFKNKYEELNKPNTGNYSRLINTLSEELTDFERESLAEKSEKVEISLPEEFQEHFQSVIKNTISEEMKKDSSFLRYSTDELLNRINSILVAKNLAPITIHEDLLEFPDYKKSINSYLQFNRIYRGELIKKGLMEYFVALRDYIGIIMVATGLLAPFSIIANLSENGFLKHLSKGIKIGMATISLSLVIYGIFDLRKRIPLKRKEEFIRELGKAREHVTSEGKRICNDISRDWMSISSSWIKEISTLITNAFEKTIKELQTAKTSQLNKEKIQMQRQQQGLDLMHKNLASAEKIKDAINLRHKEMYADTEKILLNTVAAKSS